MTVNATPTFPACNVLALATARSRYDGGMMVTVTRTTTGAIADWAFATVARIDGRPMERAPGRRVRFQPADEGSALVRFALALLDPAYSGYRGRPKLDGVVMLSPATCMAQKGDDGAMCGDVLSTPRSIAEGRGPTCGGRYAEMTKRANVKRARVASAWSGVLPSAWTRLAGEATDQLARDAASEARAPRCSGTCDVNATCLDCDGPRA